jgi:hypothetical protein
MSEEGFNYNEYMKKYMLKRYHDRRLKSFILLGGKCGKCGIVPDKYDFDHINPELKSFDVSSIWSFSEKKFLQELSKCQILCEKCHAEKTLVDRGMNNAREVHGTISSYRYCKCDLCKKAKSEYSKKKRLEKENALVAQSAEQ